MDFIKNFFSELDSRILDINWSDLFDWSYVTSTSQDSFYLQNWAIFISVSGIIISYLMYRFFLRPKKKIDKHYRFKLRDFSKRNILLFLTLAMFVFFRTQSFKFLNIRLIPLMIIDLMVINLGILIYQMIKVKKYNKLEKVPASEEYQKYLPRKKKK